MLSFVFNPAAKRESLKEFTARVHEFCTENPVVNIAASSLGPSLVLTMMLAEEAAELGMPAQATLMPYIDLVSGTDAMLEEVLERLQTKINADHKDDDMRVPIAQQLVARTDRPNDGWAVVIVVNGEVDDEGIAPGDGQDAPPDDSSGITPERIPG